MSKADFSQKETKAASDAVKGKSGMPKKTLALVAIGGLLTFLAGFAVIGYATLNYLYVKMPDKPEQMQVFEVRKGSGLSRIASDLKAQGLIDNALIFKLITKVRGNEANFKAGEFALSRASSMEEIYNTLAEGKAILYPFTAPEGLTSAQIVHLMAGVESLRNDEPAIPVEGTLLPETYMTPRSMTYSELVADMQRAQTRLIDSLWEERQADLPIKTKQEAIILASVVEKETGIGGERREVAGVFINRLRRGMRLESDPTIIYGITQGEPLGRGIRRSEIDRKTDWNTYQIDGLPKTPICNPGAEAIRAVLDPAETDALFFVADGTGGHVFSKTLAEHNRNVKQWRKIERARKRANEKKKAELRR